MEEISEGLLIARRVRKLVIKVVSKVSSGFPNDQREEQKTVLSKDIFWNLITKGCCNPHKPAVSHAKKTVPSMGTSTDRSCQAAKADSTCKWTIQRL